MEIEFDRIKVKIIAIMRMLSPSEAKSKVYSVIYLISNAAYVLSKGQKTFYEGELFSYVSKEPVINKDNFMTMFTKMTFNGLIEKNDEGKYFLYEESRTALSHFFALSWAPRSGRTGFRKFLLQTKPKKVKWACLYLSSNVFGPYEVSDAANIDSALECDKYLTKLSRDGALVRTGTYSKNLNGFALYRLNNEEKIIDDLIRKLSEQYSDYQAPRKPFIKDRVIEVLQEHGKLSFENLCKHLQLLSDLKQISVFSRQVVYHYVDELAENGKVKVWEIPSEFGKPRKWLQWIEKEDEAEREALENCLRDLLTKVGIMPKEDFFTNLSKNETHVLRVFINQISCLLFAQDDHEHLSWQMWTDLVNNFDKQHTSASLFEFISAKSKIRAEAGIKQLEDTYEDSPALLATLRFFNLKNC